MLLSELAKYLGAELIPPRETDGAWDLDVRGVEPIATARPGSVTFIASEDFAQFLGTTAASAVIVGKPRPEVRGAQLVHKNPYWAFARTAQVFYPPKKELPGRAPTAHIDPAAEIDATATVYPFAYISAGAKLGPRVVVYPGVFIGERVVIAEDTVVKANAVIEADVQIGKRVLIHAGTVIGADGFGFAPGAEGHAKIPQIGGVIVNDDVEIGALSTVDRGALEHTVVGRGTKMDDHTHLAHGTSTGEHCIMCAYAALAGSAHLGNWVVIGGHTGVTNKVRLADRVQVGACSGVTKDLDEEGVYIGFPAQPAGEWRRQIARARRFTSLEDRIKALEATIAALTKANEAP